MAYEIPGRLISMTAGADFSGANKQYTFVKMSADNTIVAAGDGDLAIGVIQNNPASGAMASVMIDGVSKVNFSASVAAGNPVASDVNGNVQVGTASTKYRQGVVLQDGGALNQLGTVQLALMGKGS